MNRFHVHLNVADLSASIRFYTALFASEPAVLKDDYAKWMLEDPRVNFAISSRDRASGVDHLGFQVESESMLAALGERLDAAGVASQPETGAICCYARSDKVWVEDPQGVKWESFRTLGEATTYNGGARACATDGSSCSPDMPAERRAVEPPASCCAPDSNCC
ncbi:ArsI/CadI family heavy metal resistance metalloenzyme [Marilutibacter maris]|uniref:VOC domain-containing protein n=1 Tax=Marilutibacter maris TaxID=1605891 RepID=A0A2U9T5R6_9GAMM|nr:ArsI/CadI family heavy metal resistance metalloenzyme [Lysobacter maris]AWV08106.1 hypothetical protein C9I47_2428 [Lysobacter maris]